MGLEVIETRANGPQMGAVAAELADFVIITSDNPRSEDPAEICSSIEKGLLMTNPHVPYQIEVDRRRAIREAVAMVHQRIWS